MKCVPLFWTRPKAAITASKWGWSSGVSCATPSTLRHLNEEGGVMERNECECITSNRKASRAIPTISCSASTREPYGSLMWTMCSWNHKTQQRTSTIRRGCFIAQLTVLHTLLFLLVGSERINIKTVNAHASISDKCVKRFPRWVPKHGNISGDNTATDQRFLPFEASNKACG